jgi:hypothetical protein
VAVRSESSCFWVRLGAKMEHISHLYPRYAQSGGRLCKPDNYSVAIKPAPLDRTLHSESEQVQKLPVRKAPAKVEGKTQVGGMIRATEASRNTLKDRFRSPVVSNISPGMEPAKAPGMRCLDKLCGNPRPQSRDARRPAREPSLSKVRPGCSGNSAAREYYLFERF